jgi:hypothetical protein
MRCLIVNVNAEKVIVVLVVASFALTSMSTLITAGNPLTKEEAIEISRNTAIVQQALDETGGEMIVEAEYWSAEYINSLMGKYPSDVTEDLPNDHGVWRVHWVNYAPGYRILHFIDELTGKVLHESWFIAG